MWTHLYALALYDKLTRSYENDKIHCKTFNKKLLKTDTFQNKILEKYFLVTLKFYERVKQHCVHVIADVWRLPLRMRKMADTCGASIIHTYITVKNLITYKILYGASHSRVGDASA